MAAKRKTRIQRQQTPGCEVYTAGRFDYFGRFWKGKWSEMKSSPRVGPTERENFLDPVRHNGTNAKIERRNIGGVA
jgi:hypothetical protein